MNDHKTAESDYKLQHVRAFLCLYVCVSVCLSEWNNWTRTWHVFIIFLLSLNSVGWNPVLFKIWQKQQTLYTKSRVNLGNLNEFIFNWEKLRIKFVGKKIKTHFIQFKFFPKNTQGTTLLQDTRYSHKDQRRSKCNMGPCRFDLPSG